MRKNMSRAGRQDAIVLAVYHLMKESPYRPITSYSICKRMGVTRQTRLYEMMLALVDEGVLEMDVVNHRRGWLKATFSLSDSGLKYAKYLLAVESGFQRIIRINGVDQSCQI